MRTPDFATCRWISLGLIVLAAVFSYGFYHFDEHYQVLEFAAFKLGRVPELTWEYGARMRSWFLPALYVQPMRLLQSLGVENPFHWSVLCRLLIGVAVWAAAWRLWRVFSEGRPAAERHRVAVWGAVLCVFPYFAVRTSLESFTSVFLLLAVSDLLVMHARRRWPALRVAGVGVLLGLMVLARFPSGLFAVGIFAWCALQARVPWKKLLLLPLAATAVLLLSLPLERWGYGEWTLPLWNFFEQNLIHGKAQEFGSSPFFAYLYLPWANALFWLLLPLMGAALWAFYKNPKHLFTWLAVPYVLGHSALAHKEARFLLPLIWLLPPLWILAGNPALRARRLFVALNALALVLMIFSVGRSEISLRRWVLARYPERFETVLLAPHNPFASAGLPAYMQQPRQLRVQQVQNYVEAEKSLLGLSQKFLITRDLQLPEAYATRCTTLWRSFPPALLQLNVFRWVERTPMWALHRCG